MQLSRSLGMERSIVAHHLRNTSENDRVYLMGGECRYAEASNFPTLNKQKVRFGGEVHEFDLEQ